MPVVLLCHHCQQSFSRPPSQAHLKYCSRTCYEIIRSTSQTLHCKHCGTSFVRDAADLRRVGHGQYCSKQCQGLATRLPLEQRFAIFVEQKHPNECWPWIGSITPKGYGTFHLPDPYNRRSYKSCSAHVIAFELTYGPVPLGKQVNHKCDTRHCCNPAHLYAGTQQENLAEMFQRGRANPRGAVGARNVHAKLTEEDVVFIRNSPEQGTVLACQYGVSPSTIWSIRKRKTWRHLL